MAPRIQVVNARVNIRSKLYILTRIRDRLAERGENCYKMFKNSVFGPWLNVRTQDHNNHLLNFLLFHQRNVKDFSCDTPYIFDIGQHTIEMGRREFCLITGFRFGDISLDHLQKVKSSFMNRVFPGLKILKGQNLYSLLEDERFKHLAEPDAVRVCLLLAADYCFMGQELRHVMVKEIVALVDDLDEWNAFPWGEHMWQESHERNYMVVSEKRDDYLEEHARMGPAYHAVYNLWGFAFALKILVLETFPQSKLWWDKDEKALPRGVAWGDVTGFKKSDYNKLFYSTKPLQTIIPTAAEKESLWWISSLEYFDKPGVSSSRKNKPAKRDKIRSRVCRNFYKKGIRTSVRIRTEVHTTVVEEHYSDDDDSSDVEVDESLRRMSKKQLMNYVVNMEGRLAAVEQLVKSGKVSIDVTDPVVNHPAKESTADANIVIELCGDVEKPNSHNNAVYHTVDVVQDSKSSIKEPMEDDADKKMKGDVDEEDAVKDPIEEDVVKEPMEKDGFKEPMEEDDVAVKDPVVVVKDHVVAEANEKDGVELKDIFVSPTPQSSIKEPMEDDADKKMKGDVDEEDAVKDPIEEDVVKEPMEKDGFKEPIEEDDVAVKDPVVAVKDHVVAEANEKDGVELKDIFVSPTPHDSANDLTDLNYFSSLPDNMFQDMNGSLDQHMDLGVAHVDAQQDLGPIPDNSVTNEVINGLFDEHMGVGVTHADAEQDLSPIPDCSVIDVDMHMDDGIKTVRVPFGRERKKSRHLCDPYTPPPPTTPRRSKKCRPRSRMYKSTVQFLIGTDGNDIQLEPWREELTRPEGSLAGVVNPHQDINSLLRSKKEMKFHLSWVNGDFYNKFWVGLVGKDRNRRGWLSDWHIDAWFMYMWHFRPQDADWVMVGPYFNAQLLSRDIPFYYADGITYGVPWCAENVEKVYFPINEPNIHWALGMLHLRSGVVTIYDSLHGPDEEGKPWWDSWMEHFAAVIPPYMEEADVMAKKNIDPKSYSITFRYEEDVPMQSGYYGDCGIWVCVFLYRLTHNLPLIVDDPAAFALAYREQMISFFWKYKKVISIE